CLLTSAPAPCRRLPLHGALPISIRRITHVLDARQFRAVPISAPTSDELARPYLWRFWRELPRPGNITIFDRSWYGRVLVERVEKDRKSTRLNSSHVKISYAVFCS